MHRGSHSFSIVVYHNYFPHTMYALLYVIYQVELWCSMPRDGCRLLGAKGNMKVCLRQQDHLVDSSTPYFR